MNRPMPDTAACPPGDVVGEAPLPGGPFRLLVLAPSREDALPHIARIEAKAMTAAASASTGTRPAWEWDWRPLAAFLPLLTREATASTPFPPTAPDLLLCLDDGVLGVTGRLALLRLVREHLPETPLLLLVGEATAEEAVEALRAGASDLLVRRDWETLPLLAERAIRQRALRHRTLDRARQERDREGQRVRISEAKYRALFELAPEPLAVVQSITGTLLLANRALRTFLGFPETDAPGGSAATGPGLVGRHLSVLFPPEIEAEADRLLLRLREGRGTTTGLTFLRPWSPHPGQDRVPASPRAPLPVDLRAAPVPWGPLEAVVISFQDAAVREATGAGAALAYFALDRLGETGARGEWVLWTGEDGVILHANRPLCEALGRPLTVLRGRHLGEIAPAFGPAAWALHRSEARAYGAFQIEAFFLPNGEGDGAPLLRVEATAHALTLGGREYHCLIGRAAPAPEAAGPP